MKKFRNPDVFPRAVINFIQERLKSSKLQKTIPVNPILNFLGFGPNEKISAQNITYKFPGMADVRWMSECNSLTMECSGYLLGRWLVDPSNIKPFESDFIDPKDLDSANLDMCEYQPMHLALYDFAVLLGGIQCVLVEIDVEGRVRRSRYELPNGIDSTFLGKQIGPIVEESVQRKLGDLCVPRHWKPRPSD